MLKRLLIVFALLTGTVHVMNIYLMPNISHRPLAKGAVDGLEILSHKHADTASDTPYKIKFRKFFCQTGEKKIALIVSAPQELLIGCQTFLITGFLYTGAKEICPFNVAHLKSPPDLILDKCCWLI